MSPSPRFILATAAFGEGHNSAARNLATALEAAGASCHVCDPCLLASPRTTRMLSRAYRWVTTHAPRLWQRIYRSTDDCDFSKTRLPFMNAPERLLGLLSSTYRADAVICTYPIYPYFMQRWNAANGKKPLIFTVVTDSIEVNSAWLRAPTDYWLVTDTRTREIMLAQGAPAERVVVTGFPVHPDFAESTPIAADDCCDPFRILYFPTAKLPFIRRHSRALLEASPHVHLTIILGRNVRALYSRAKEIQQQYPGRVKLIGWTSRVPAYLNRHHLVVGKAGGATVHEAIAARCPMLIHHLVPGQEEGNLRLLEDLGAGFLAATPTALGEAVDAMLANQAHSWKAMKASLTEHAMHDGATRAAEFILTTLRR